MTDLDTILALIDLTSLDASDSRESTQALCARALRPDPNDPSAPPVAAVCVLGHLVEHAVAALDGTGVAVAAVAGAFPSGLAPVDQKVAEAVAVVAAGAVEVDVTIDRVALLGGRPEAVSAEISAIRAAVPAATLKVILETGELPDLATVAEAAWLVVEAGADMVKTSTGKGPPGANPKVAATLLETVAAYTAQSGRPVGVKVSGGIRTVPEALEYLHIAQYAFGPTPTPAQFRFGASALLDAVVAARRV
ncbi:MAG: deoxyribose-phosphate aldolase [Sporichthyaceae bacterium]